MQTPADTAGATRGTDDLGHPFSNPAHRAQLALELRMRDALSGLEELASLDVYWFEPGCMEILGIEPPVRPSAPAVKPAAVPHAKILDFPQAQRRTG